MSTRELVVTIRPPAPADLPRAESVVAATTRLRPSEMDIAVEVFADAARRPGADYHALAAFDEESLLGFVCFGSTPGTEHTWDLYWIVVDPAVQRQGIGGRLLDAAEAAIRTAKGRLIVIETSSRTDYGDTRGFYVGHGYGRAARIPDYYEPDDDLIVYTKDLGTDLAPARDGIHG